LLLIVATIAACLKLGQDKLDADLIEAVVARKPAVAISLLRQGANANAIQTPGARRSLRQMLSGLLARFRGQRPVHEHEHDLSVLMLACSWGKDVDNQWKDEPADKALLEQLLARGADPNVDSWVLQESALETQVRAGNAAGVSLLLDHGADPNYIRVFSPLRVAIIWNHMDIACLLIKRGANVRETGSDDAPVLTEAACMGDGRPVVEILLAKGADINAIDNNGLTALMTAVINALPDNVRFLLDHRANASIKDKKGRSALDYALALSDSAEKRVIVKMLKRKDR
jgi:ankyrin repeat protein